MRTSRSRCVPRVASVCQSSYGVSLDSAQSYSLHVLHDSSSCFISADIPGQQIHSFARLRHAFVPCEKSGLSVSSFHGIWQYGHTFSSEDDTIVRNQLVSLVVNW